MIARHRLSTGLVLLALLLSALAAGLALAAPGMQTSGQNLPTPTLFPAENTPYTLEVVGGAPQTYTFTYADQDAFTLGDTTVTSEYPLGMTFTLAPTSTGGGISDVTLHVTFVHGILTRFSAAWNAEKGAWIARPWDTGGQPPWTSFDFYWRVRDASGAYIDTPAHHMDYFDPTNSWFRTESDYLILYWRGFGEDNPDAIAQKMADVTAGTEPRKIGGFGRQLSYKPLAVIFPDRDAISGMYASGVSDTFAAGFTSSDLGMSVQVLRSNEYAPDQENCVWATKPEDWTMERRINTIYGVTTHEVGHLYQFDVLGGALGPTWFSEGQADYFSSTPGNYDERLRYLATLQDIPSLQTDIGTRLNQADGCYALGYDVGVSFVNWLLDTYGGLPFHLQLAEKMRLGESVFKAVEDLTGQPFLDVENAWRAYLGYRPITAADLDPALALQPYEDPLIKVGDSVTLPATPAMVNLGEAPKPKSLMSGTCFANTAVKVLAMGQLDGVAYFQVDCMGMVGWVTRDVLVGPQP